MMTKVFEALALRCPRELAPQTEELLRLCLDYIAYDPNYNYDDTAEDDDGGEMDVDEDGAGSDDDDNESIIDTLDWKIRRAAAKFISTVIRAPQQQQK
jgi:cullin-associated NEDD8-dissociated protein 1